MTKLPFETKGGYFSRDDAIMRAVEHDRKAAEEYYALGHYYKLQGNHSLGDMWLQLGKKFEEAAKLTLMLATKGGIQ